MIGVSVSIDMTYLLNIVSFGELYYVIIMSPSAANNLTIRRKRWSGQPSRLIKESIASGYPINSLMNLGIRSWYPDFWKLEFETVSKKYTIWIKNPRESKYSIFNFYTVIFTSLVIGLY